MMSLFRVYCPFNSCALFRVKLVEKALPASEEDQIRSQDSLKRSLEISAGLFGMCQYFRNLLYQSFVGEAIIKPTGVSGKRSLHVRISGSMKNYR